jgi:hypothetical protein
MFQRNIFSRKKMLPSCLFLAYCNFCPEDGGSIFLLFVSELPLYHMSSHHGRSYSSKSLKIQHCSIVCAYLLFYFNFIYIHPDIYNILLIGRWLVWNRLAAFVALTVRTALIWPVIASVPALICLVHKEDCSTCRYCDLVVLTLDLRGLVFFYRHTRQC